MALTDTHVERLKQSIAKLILLHKKADSESVILRSRLTQLQKELEAEKQKRAELENKLTELILRRSITEVSGGVKSAKQRVNALLRDIDRCLALMNK